MKKLFNSKERMPDDMIDGFVAAYPEIIRGQDPRVVRRKNLSTKDGKLAILIGNGCGHEPIAMGFVGKGLLDANVVGVLFPEPTHENYPQITIPPAELC